MTKDGTCGPKNGGTICGNFSEGGVSALFDLLAVIEEIAYGSSSEHADLIFT